MIRVRLVTQITAATAAIASFPMMAGCAADHDDSSAAQTGALAETGIEAGSGTVSLYGYQLSYRSTSGGDEFMRVGERIQAQLNFSDALNMIVEGSTYDAALIADLKSDPSKLKTTLKVTYTKFDDTTIDAAYPVTFAPGVGGIYTGSSTDFAIPERVKTMTADFVAEYTQNGAPQKKELLASQGLRRDLVVFGGYAPDKLALFDTLGPQDRTRIVEGGGAVPGANLTISIADYRLATDVNTTSLDQTYGKRNSYSRFGPIVAEAYGTLDYTVSAAISVDGGKTFLPLDLAKVDDAEVVRGQRGRYAYEKTLAVPPNAGPAIQIAFHVQVFLQVPNYNPGEVIDAKYGPGQRVLLREMWDNNGGSNFSIPVSQQ